MLCTYCDCLNLNDLRTGCLHQPSYSALNESANNGCELCLLFKTVLAKSTAVPSALQPESTLSWALGLGRREEGVFLLQKNDLNFGVRIALRCERSGVMVNQYAQLHMFVASESPLASDIAGREVFQSVESTGALALMDKWIKDCIRNHPDLPEDSRLCKDLTHDFQGDGEIPQILGITPSLQEGEAVELYPPLPTRVIDVGPSDGSGVPYLFEAKEVSRAYYITLSHCWGPPTHKPLTTTIETLAERRNQIPEAQLPKTFKEAVFLTRRFGIRYLWIDSLCILQNSTDDWQHEAALMGQYYRNSFLTISAAGSQGSHQGCFLPRTAESQAVQLNLKQISPAVSSPPKCSRSCWPCASPRKPPQEQMLPMPNGTDAYISVSDYQIPFISPEAVDSRAWILQETALSPRVLLFGEKMMAWLCNTKHCTERGDDILHETTSHYVMAPRLPHHLRHATEYEVTDIGWLMAQRWVTMEASTWWAKMVQNYSTRNLTVESDKFPAISGCARAIRALNKDVYYAGLWGRTLPNDLLWQSVEAGKASRSREYRSPSWSWAAINGEVKCCITGKYDSLSKKLIEEMEVEAQYVSEDTFGQIKSMLLFLRGSPARVKVQDQELDEAADWATGNRVSTLKAVDPPCSCEDCVANKKKFGNWAQELKAGSASKEATNLEGSDTFSGVGGTDVYLSQEKMATTFRYTGLEGGELGNSGPQYTEGNFDIEQAGARITSRVLEHFRTENAGSCIFDVESERKELPEMLWCLPITPQMGLLLVADRCLSTEGGEVPRYRRVGVVKLNLSWMPVHVMTRLVLA